MMWKWPTFVLIFGHLLPTAYGVPGAMFTSSNPSGVLCGVENPVRCITGAACVSGKCLCPKGTFGDGAFNCYESSDYRAEIQGPKNMLRTFQNSSGSFMWPCRFRFLEVITRRTSNQRDCHFQVFGINKIIGGRVALAGMEVHVNLKNDLGHDDGIGIRNEGTSNYGHFTYHEWGKFDFELEKPVKEVDSTVHRRDDSIEQSGSGSFSSSSEDDDRRRRDVEIWGHPQEIVSGDSRVLSEADPDNFARIHVDDCGFRARFRAPDVIPQQQVQASGLSVAINSNNEPVWNVWDEPANTYIAESVPDKRLLFHPRVEELFPDQKPLHWLHIALEYAAQQDETPEGEECDETGQIYRAYCDSPRSKVTALHFCSFFLSSDLVKCMDPSGDKGPPTKSVNAFKLCIWNACQPSKYVCGLLRARIKNANCETFLPQHFNDFQCDT